MSSNFKMMRKRLEFNGGIAQEARMIKDKYRTFLKTLKYSYQGCDVQLIQHYDELLPEDWRVLCCQPQYRALINPDKNKQDYDDKVLSIDYAYDFGPGDVFRWVNTDTYWIIYLQELTEDAYFKGEIRRCRYQIKFKDEAGNTCSTWAAIRGPVETQINSIQKNLIRLDQPNLSLNILIPRNEHTLAAFDRYKEFIFADKCWRVEAPDSISMTNIIEINAEKYFIDKDTDNDVKNGLVIEPIDPSPDTDIIGETFIKPQIPERYRSPKPYGKWCVVEPKDAPVCIKSINGSVVEVVWNKMVSGQFTLRWSDGEEESLKTIVVESLM